MNVSKCECLFCQIYSCNIFNNPVNTSQMHLVSIGTPPFTTSTVGLVLTCRHQMTDVLATAIDLWQDGLVPFHQQYALSVSLLLVVFMYGSMYSCSIDGKTEREIHYFFAGHYHVWNIFDVFVGRNWSINLENIQYWPPQKVEFAFNQLVILAWT